MNRIVKSPTAEALAGRNFYASMAPDLDVGFFSSLWHLISLGHLVSVDLDRIAKDHGLSIADLLVLGTLRIAAPQPLRPTDLAFKLHISNAALSARVTRMVKAGLIERSPVNDDRRSYVLSLTRTGSEKADLAITQISREGKFANAFAKLNGDDRDLIECALGNLHDLMSRDFLPSTR